MTVFDNVKSNSIDEFSKWLDEYARLDDYPWDKYFDENFCNKCECVTKYVPEWHRNVDFAWCELNGKCRFFKEFNNVPDNKQTIKIWLESETQ